MKISSLTLAGHMDGLGEMTATITRADNNRVCVVMLWDEVQDTPTDAPVSLALDNYVDLEDVGDVWRMANKLQYGLNGEIGPVGEVLATEYFSILRQFVDCQEEVIGLHEEDVSDLTSGMLNDLGRLGLGDITCGRPFWK